MAGLLATVAASACGSAATPGSAHSPAATVAGRTLDGRAATLAALHGHPVVLVFWAAWCGPCHDEQPRINAAYARWRSHGVDFLGVDMLDVDRAAIAFQHQFDVPYPSVADHDAAIAAGYQIPAAPALAFVDAQGHAGDRVLGGLGVMTDADLDRELAALVHET